MLPELAHKSARLDANRDWIRVGAALGVLCNVWARRNDLRVYVGADGGQGIAPAFYLHEEGEIEINAPFAFGVEVEADDVGDLLDPIELASWSRAGGVAFHEACHARWTTLDFAEGEAKAGSPGAWAMYTAMEEVRIEGMGIVAWPDMRGFLKSCAKHLILDDNEGASPRLTCVLFLGRRDVGVLDGSDVAPLESWLLGLGGRWSKEIIERAQLIWGKFVKLDDSVPSQQKEMFMLARELDSILPPDPVDEGLKAFNDLIDELLDRIESDGKTEAIDAGVSMEAREEARKEEKEFDRREHNERKAKETFALSGGNGPMSSKVHLRRDPLGTEVAAAITLSMDLERVKYRDRTMEIVASESPPGKLRGSTAMRMDAAKSLGLNASKFTPFKRKVHHEVEDEHVTVGAMCDLSGSMGSVMEPMGVAVYVLGQAVGHLKGSTFAQVYFGAGVYPGLEPGMKTDKVTVMKAQDGWEDFKGGFEALDGALNLLAGEGPRLLVVTSDGQFGKSGQMEACRRILRECVDNGVGVLWLGLRDGDLAQRLVEEIGPGATYLRVPDGDVTGVAGAIGSACVNAMEMASV